MSAVSRFAVPVASVLPEHGPNIEEVMNGFHKERASLAGRPKKVPEVMGYAVSFAATSMTGTCVCIDGGEIKRP